jgi:tRNA(fMet)-specific endonuclease VapC
MTLAELYRWALERNWGPRKVATMDAYLQRYLIYPFNRALCMQWAVAKVQAQRGGRTMKTDDAWIAATALLYGIPLVTHNRRHFEVLEPGLTVISES